MNKPEGKRKSGRYFSNSTKKKGNFCLSTGYKGFLCTCNGMEKQSVKEAKNILYEYADKLKGEHKLIESEHEESNTDTAAQSSEVADVDIADEFEKEIQSLKEPDKTDTLSFTVIDTSIPNCIFIRTWVEDPVVLAHSILNDLYTTRQRKTRFLMRMVPIEVTCKAYLENIMEGASPLLDKYFKTEEATTFSIVFNRRFSNSVDRDSIIKELASEVMKRNSSHKVDLKHSKLTIVVEILKSICCLAVVPDFFKLSKYNLGAVCGSEESAETVEKEAYAIEEEIPEQLVTSDSITAE